MNIVANQQANWYSLHIKLEAHLPVVTGVHTAWKVYQQTAAHRSTYSMEGLSTDCCSLSGHRRGNYFRGYTKSVFHKPVFRRSENQFPRDTHKIFIIFRIPASSFMVHTEHQDEFRQ